MINWIKKLWEIWLFKYHKRRGCEMVFLPTFERGEYFWMEWRSQHYTGYLLKTLKRYQVKAKKGALALIEEKPLDQKL